MAKEEERRFEGLTLSSLLTSPRTTFKPLLQWRPRLLSLCNFHSAVTARRESAGDSNSVSYQLSPRKKGLIGVYLLRPVYLWILQGKMDFARFDLIYHK